MSFETADAVYTINGKQFYPPGSQYVPFEVSASFAHVVTRYSQQLDPPVDYDTLLMTMLYNYLYGIDKMYVFDSGETRPLLPGHFWGSKEYGPSPGHKDVVLVLGKNPAYGEFNTMENFSGDFGKILRETLQRNGIDEVKRSQFYFANACRVEATDKRSFATAMKDCRILLQNEICILQPKFIVCIGADALHLFTRRSITAASYEELYYNYLVPSETGPIEKIAQIYALPLGAMREYTEYLKFKRRVKDFVHFHFFNTPRTSKEINYTVVNSVQELKGVVDKLLENPGVKWAVSLDAEWNGRFITDQNAYLRCITFSCDTDDLPESEKFTNCNCAFLIPVQRDRTETNLDPASLEEYKQGISRELQRLLQPGNNICIVGHNFFMDISWFKLLNLDISRKYETGRLNEQGNYEGELYDTILMYHAVDETAGFDLESAAEVLIGVQPWSIELEVWKKEYCKQQKISLKQLEGYGLVPDEILYPYAARDACYTLQIFKELKPQLSADRYGNNCSVPYLINHYASLGFAEMFESGIRIDKQKANMIMNVYVSALEHRLEQFRAAINWPTFNFRSHPQCAAFLFGFLKGNVQVPEGAKCLNAQPVKSTDKMPWTETSAAHGQSPSVDIESCRILAGSGYPEAAELYKLRILNTVVRNVLCPPDINGEEDGSDEKASGGILQFICDDGKIHPRYSPLKETRRCSCAAPNLQNIANDREKDYAAILGEDYPGPIKSIFVADPGYVLLEVDYSGAELLALGLTAFDEQLISDYYRSALPDTDPNKLDIHSMIAVQAFGLKCAPTKRALKEIGKEHCRFCAKRVIFGINYGRGAESCHLQLLADGVENITVDDVQQVIHSIHKRYPKIAAYHREAKLRVRRPGWICNCFGSYRRFWTGRSKDSILDAEREAINFPCQSIVADAIACVMKNLYDYRKGSNLVYRLVMHNHDALTIAVLSEQKEEFIEKVLPVCFQQKVPLFSCTLDGKRRSNQEYFFNYEVKTLAEG